MADEREALGVTESDIRGITRAERKARYTYLVTGAVTGVLSFLLGKLTYDALGRPLDSTYPYAVALVSAPTLSTRRIIPWLVILVVAFVAFLAGARTEADMGPPEGTYYGVYAVGSQPSTSFGKPIHGCGPTRGI